MLKIQLRKIILIGSLLGPSMVAHGVKVKNAVTSTTAIVATCSLATINDVAFGDYDASASNPKTGTTTISVTCTNGAPYTIELNKGTNGGSVTARSMKKLMGSNLLNYNLYTDNSRSTIWGDGTGGTAIVSGTGTGSSQSYTVYGAIPVGQFSAPVGSYSDQVKATVNF